MSDYAKEFCSRCDHYRGYVCAEHREPSYEEQQAEIEQLRLQIRTDGHLSCEEELELVKMEKEALERENERLRTQRLSDEDIDRIARKAVEVVMEDLGRRYEESLRISVADVERWINRHAARAAGGDDE